MTRLAVEHGAVNLSQGFPDEPPPVELVTAAFEAMMGGTVEGVERLAQVGVRDLTPQGETSRLTDALAALQHPRDLFNQYSFPFGLRDLRVAIADYTERLYGFRPEPDTEVTVSLGATEGLCSALGSLLRPGDGVIVMQPFHEVYPNQARVFGLRPVFVTLRENRATGRWELDLEALEHVARAGARAIVLNTPHNPTGKVFTDEELTSIARLCQTYDMLAITDEIYEHMVYSGRHECLATLPGMRERTIVVNSISKTGSATGWRVGWVIAPPEFTSRLRGVHDTLVIQAPTPLQKAAIRLLEQPQAFYDRLRATYLQKRTLLTGALQRVGFRVSPPEGAYYLFADYREVPVLRDLSPMPAAMTLIEKYGVASVPGDNFYAGDREGDRYLRFAFCRSLTTLGEAARRLDALGSRG